MRDLVARDLLQLEEFPGPWPKTEQNRYPVDHQPPAETKPFVALASDIYCHLAAADFRTFELAVPIVPGE
jgi:hypothetical protein